MKVKVDQAPRSSPWHVGTLIDLSYSDAAHEKMPAGAMGHESQDSTCIYSVVAMRASMIVQVACSHRVLVIKRLAHLIHHAGRQSSNRHSRTRTRLQAS